MSEDSSVLAKLATVNELETKCYLLEPVSYTHLTLPTNREV